MNISSLRPLWALSALLSAASCATTQPSDRSAGPVPVQASPPVATAAGAPSAARTPNSVATDLTGWRVTGLNRELYSLTVDRQVFRSGQASALLQPKEGVEVADSTWASSVQSIDATPFRGKRVRMRAYLRSQASNAWTWFRVDGTVQDGLGGLAFANSQSFDSIRGPTDWRPVDLVLDIPAEAIVMVYGAGMNGKGKLWIDDVSLEAVGSSVGVTQLPRDGPWRWTAEEEKRSRDAWQTRPPGKPMNLGFEQ